MTLVSTNEALGHKDSLSRECFDTSRLEATERTFERSESARYRKKRREHERVEAVTCHRRTDGQGNPAGEREHRQRELPARVASWWQYIVTHGGQKRNQEREYGDGGEIEQVKPSASNMTPPHRDQNR